MDEELITQAGDGVTQAKRARVVVSGRTGASIVDPVAADPGKSPYSMPALGVGLVDDSPPGNYARGELRPVSLTVDGRLRASVVFAITFIDFFGDAPDYRTPVSFTGGNPWSY